MTELQLLVAILCVSPFVTFGLCAVWRILELNSRDGDTKRFPRPGTEPFRPESKIKPFRKSSDMLTRVDDDKDL